MKKRTAKDLRELNSEELVSSLRDLEESLTRLRFQKSLGQLHNTAHLRDMRKDIARIHTLLGERNNVVK